MCPKRIKKIIALVILFALVCFCSTMASFTFASYKSGYEERFQSSIAKPIVVMESGGLYRTSKEGDEYEYSITETEEGIISFDDIQPQDVIDYYFSINNYTSYQNNEVNLMVTLTVRVYLRKLTADGNVDEYFVVGNDYLIGADGTQTDVNNSNFSIYYGKDDSLTTTIGNYINIPLDFSTDKGALAEEDYDGKTIKYNNDSVYGYYQQLGFIFNASDTQKQKAFLLKITLSDQTMDADDYVSGKLYIEIIVDCEQIQ